MKESLIDFRRDDLPVCAYVMGCYCAGHARGNPADSQCDTSKKGPETEDEIFLD